MAIRKFITQLFSLKIISRDSEVMSFLNKFPSFLYIFKDFLLVLKVAEHLEEDVIKISQQKNQLEGNGSG